MTATFTWTVTRLDVKAQLEEYANVIYMASFICEATQENNGEVFKAQINTGIELPTPTGEFIPFDQLTEEQILGWVWSSGIDKEKVQNSLQQKLDREINPDASFATLPWVA